MACSFRSVAIDLLVLSFRQQSRETPIRRFGLYISKNADRPPAVRVEKASGRSLKRFNARERGSQSSTPSLPAQVPEISHKLLRNEPQIRGIPRI
jgi:hypothetical protein